MIPVNTIICGDWVEVGEGLPDKLLHCIITSPPYWGQRDYGVEGQLGSEKTVEEHIEKLVAGFRVLRQKLRDDGVLFLNYGDAYWGSGKGYGDTKTTNENHKDSRQRVKPEWPENKLKTGDLMGLAWRLALALQADGWILRSDTIWAKAVSFCDKYSGSTMPESVNGWRWERCRVSLGGSQKSGGMKSGLSGFPSMNKNPLAKWVDCPGCAKCKPNDGLVLRRGSWRPTRAHEYLFQFVKTGNYYCDMEAVKEELAESTQNDKRIVDGDFTNQRPDRDFPGNNSQGNGMLRCGAGRNLRDVWTINPQAYPDAHYATFPEKLVEPCIKVATSQKGVCPTCGSQWARVVDKQQVKRDRPADKTDRHKQGDGVNSCGNTVAGVNTTTIGWRPTCGCVVEEPVPAIVYDPFMGSGTVAAVAARLGRNYIGSELNESYITEQADYRVAEAETGISKQEQLAGQRSLFSE
ncbi:hypothetical protein LCGC14_0403690 [marine sediment metagenome]|uniref:site-specific DNA-methyltransferase (cytosine-N(4)-specific) n=1 Tax=marine sediment metagenome TaxID=412755 RepID=A0A0F9VI47_9ZZZZ